LDEPAFGREKVIACSVDLSSRCYAWNWLIFAAKPLSTDAKGWMLSPMGNSQGRDNARKRARRRKKTERLALAKTARKKTK
jgi:hypothetical protein